MAHPMLRQRAKLLSLRRRRSDMARPSRIIGGRETSTRGALGRPRSYPELSVASLVRDIEVDGRTFPAGARGTVVAAYADGKGYEVELFDPVHAVVTVETRDIAD